MIYNHKIYHIKNTFLIPNKVEKVVPIISASSIAKEIDLCLDPFKKYEHLRVTAEMVIEQNDPIITWCEAPVATVKNIIGISAASKAGKTAAMALLTAGAIAEKGDWDDFGSELKIKQNINKHAVICFDTEQSELDQQYKVKTILKRVGLKSTPDHYLEYNIRRLSINEYQETTNQICKAARDKFGGIYMILIDGGADYLLSVNDESAATLIVEYFTHLSIEFNCPVIIIVHQNPGSEKERGHFGSQLQRKCYSLLSISKKGDISTLSAKMMRKAGIGDVPEIHFKYCKEKGYHVRVDAPDSEIEKNQKDRKKHELTASEVFKPGIALNYSEAVSEIMNVTSKGERTAKTMISNMVGWKIINKCDDGRYRKNIQ